MNPTIYVITFYQHNHVEQPNSKKKNLPLDPRFIKSNHNYVYYLIDKQVPEVLKNKAALLESDIDPKLHEAGGKHFGEWSFLLAEEKYQFCQYPFYMISSRFYEKNHWIHRDLNEEWENLFSYLQHYRWGWLPSYNRPLRWIDLSWESNVPKKGVRYKFFPFTEKIFDLIYEVFGITMPKDYRFAPDLFCNYVGFQDRSALMEYVSFYRRLIDLFFDKNYIVKRDFSEYLILPGTFRNEKGFTFILEYISHLFFFVKQYQYYALHYDGYYHIDEKNKKMSYLKRFDVPIAKRCQHFFHWGWRRTKEEGLIAIINSRIRGQPLLKKCYRFIRNYLQ